MSTDTQVWRVDAVEHLRSDIQSLTNVAAILMEGDLLAKCRFEAAIKRALQHLDSWAARQ
jgi:hypothetical protein